MGGCQSTPRKHLERRSSQSSIVIHGNLIPHEKEFKYRVIKEIGAGVTGSVYLVETTYGKKIIHKAMKKINTNTFNMSQISELQQEIELLQRLDHPNIVRLVETFQNGHDIRLIMDLCTGGDLASKQAEVKLNTERNISTVISQVLGAISYLHENGICHRDIKRQNILFVSEHSLHIQVIDFGLSCYTNQRNPILGIPTNRHFETQCGTGAYMSPQVLAGKYGKECDLWAIGVLTFWLLFKHPPFETEEEVKFKELNFSHPMWQQFDPSVAILVEKLLTKDPTRRWKASEALTKCSWFDLGKVREEKTRSLSQEIVVESIRKYSTYNTIKKVALLVLAHFSEINLDELREEFNRLDVNKSGTLSYEEIKEFLLYHNKNSSFSEKKNAKKMFANIGFCGDIQLAEFLAATLETRTKINEEDIVEAFERISHGEDFITVDHLDAILGSFMNSSKIKDVISTSDANRDGKISKQEFLDYLSPKKKGPVHEEERAPSTGESILEDFEEENVQTEKKVEEIEERSKSNIVENKLNVNELIVAEREEKVSVHKDILFDESDGKEDESKFDQSTSDGWEREDFELPEEEDVNVSNKLEEISNYHSEIGYNMQNRSQSELGEEKLDQGYLWDEKKLKIQLTQSTASSISFYDEE